MIKSCLYDSIKTEIKEYNLGSAARQFHWHEIRRRRKRGRGGRGVWGEFRPARASEFSIWIFFEKSSNFVQKRPPRNFK
ncbi:MAG: hypothetical protein A2660_01885 [Candidatus Doudnabacteria bacterium RIFCSPHIGHO2_01_FULL_45_18]|uniref:Uncharacterized protein n=1 Tax=Candidatus Doudnabacteria bacterium RIFCSPHIGHO2_01_FULL_45_18 TaxID=1817823 RepID=A0A1F5NRV6_9BACT|nr:MAG: hypothetical protein A2660_01885 [Candidatus Doudnabacteria bacterium RIFCSPHIGHO2_01_FULL_45_18]